MKILVLCYEYPPVGGGGGRVAAQVARGLASRGHEVKVVTAGLSHLARHEWDEKVEVLRPRSFRKREDTCSVPEMALYLITSFFPALRVCRDWQPDVLHAHFVVPTGVLALVLHGLTGIPYVLTAHLGDVPGGVPEQTGFLFRLLGPFLRPLWKKAAAVTAVSGHVAGLVREASGVRAEVILNGLPPQNQAFRAVCGDPPRILMLGRLSEQKDPLLAVRALALIRDRKWTLEVVGEGPLGGAMRALCGECGIADRVTFSGWLGGGEVSKHLAGSDILLMTSSSEGLPMAGVEALQHGLAIVGSRIGGLADIVEDGLNGFLCARTPGDFAEALSICLDNPPLLDAMRAASYATSSRFDLEDRVRDYEGVLKSAARMGAKPTE